jgi:hypothetical protein
MTHSTIVRVRVFVVLLMLVAAAGLMLADSLNYSSIKVRAARWASQVDQKEVVVLASTISESLPGAYRKALRARMTPAERSNFWINRIEKYVSANSGLSQAALVDLREITQLLVEAGPELFAQHPNATADPRLARLIELGKRAIQNMDKAEAGALLIAAGPPDNSPLVSEPLRARDRVALWLSSIFTVQAGSFDCDCNQGDDFCWLSQGWNYECWPSTCDPSEVVCGPNYTNCGYDPGCGLWELEICDALCWNSAS